MGEFKVGDRLHVDLDLTYGTEPIVGIVGPLFIEQVRDAGGTVTLIEPDWQPGDVVRDEDGCILLRSGDCWYHGMAAYHPRGRLTRLVPEATDGR